MARPWMKFYPADWRSDPRLRVCSIAARGLWIEMLCIMHEADPYGHLLVNGLPVSAKQLASFTGVPLREVSKLMGELETAGVFSVEQDVIISRRMVRDKAKEDRDRENGKGGGNPNIKSGVNPHGKPPDKAQKPEARDQKEVPPSADASASDDPRSALFDRGLKSLAQLTGKTPDSSRSLVGKWLKSVADEAIHVLAAIDDAMQERPADPVGWITARLKQFQRNEVNDGRRGQPLAAGQQGGSPITRAIQGHIAAISGTEPGSGERNAGSSRLLPFRRGE